MSLSDHQSGRGFDGFDLPEDLKEKVNAALREAAQRRLRESNPEFVETFGDITDPENPVTWKPSKRAENGLSIEDRVKYSELDNELYAQAMARLIEQHEAVESDIEQMKTIVGGLAMAMVKSGQFPELTALIDSVRAKYQASEPEDPFEGKPIPPDFPMRTVNGTIRMDQVPGYKETADWRPSPDWLDANCACPIHTAERAANQNKRPDEGLPGLYL